MSVASRSSTTVGIYSLIAGLLTTGSASAAEPSWGHLKARFVYNGVAPERAKFEIFRDKDHCGAVEHRDESLIVEKEGGLANVLVWLDARDVKLPVPADYDKTAKEKVIVDSRGCRTIPHVSLLRTGQTLELRNSDPIVHNARFDATLNTPFNVILKPEGTFSTKFERAERLPARLSCAIHPWKLGYILVQDHPYMAICDARGILELKNLPTGKWTFVFWHEAAGYLRSVEKGGEKLAWVKGRCEIEIKPGENDFGEIKLEPELFLRR